MAENTLEQMQSRLNAVKERIERHGRECRRTSGLAANPAGDTGGIRSRSRKQKDAMFDRWSRQAREGVALHNERLALDQRIGDVTSGRADARKEAKDRSERGAVAAFVRLRPGDKINVGNGDMTVTKKNRKSVVTAGLNVKWTVQEVTGVYRADLDALIAEAEAAPAAEIDAEEFFG